ncbi:Non-structural maintenance of chromosomes element 4-like protein A [Microtus ochrogaster]|uniref:Non-structural maintenance of chromosomes element 4 n=1 Tax=Microtus ochrogaster TaxID=79684 RepID=A0A8J6G9U2_MICOH|nr:Non-structural maintenance of chromosomes element 4-like protein A [Microtus ochrogaster]
MSGDSSGRRSEGRGRSRDPHRDRTRSRSRSRSPLVRRGSVPERREAAERPSLEDTEPSDSGDELMDPACLEAEYDQGLCRQIRHQYRALINSVQQNREDILNAGDKLTEVLEEANTLFSEVSRAREAVLDAQFLVLASDLGKEKAKQLRSDLSSFDMLRYVEMLLTHMGVNPLEAEEVIRDEDRTDIELIVYDSWKISGKTAENTFNKTHTFHFLYQFRLMMLETVFQTEPVINEENEGIEQNTQMRSQGIIALSYRDWEEIVKTFEISEPVISMSQSQQRLSA